MLTAAILVPLAVAIALVLGTRWNEATTRWLALVASAVPLALLVVTWIRFDPGGAGTVPTGRGGRLDPHARRGLAPRHRRHLASPWPAHRPPVRRRPRLPADLDGRHRQYRAWFLFLEAVSLGLFLTLDLLLFYVFFDLSLVGMYFLIGRWGHGDARAAALKFFLYTLAGSLVMLLGFLALYLQTDPLTFDMRTLIADPAPRRPRRHRRAGPAGRARRSRRSRRPWSRSTPGCRPPTWTPPAPPRRSSPGCC